MILALVTLATATLFVPVRVDHPLAMLLFLLGITTGFCLFGFAIGIWAKNFEQLQIIPMLVDHAADLPRRRLLLGQGARTSRGGRSPCSTRSSIWSAASAGASSRSPTCRSGRASAVTLAIIAVCMAVIAWMFRTGYRLKQ